MRRLISSLLLALPALACAQVTVLADGHIASGGGDRATVTAAPLANGVRGNALGGLGSALDYAGCGTFLALPDRGPNATAWNPALDNTTAYINRFQTLRMSLHPAAPGARWPMRMRAQLLETTLLWSGTPLVYGSGKGLGAPSGVPALNARAQRFYFTGRSDGFDPAHASDWPRDARLDPESLRLSPDGRSVYIGDEYGPHLYRFDRASGRRLGVIRLPAWLAVAHPAPSGYAETDGNVRGRVGNHGLEGLAISADGHTLFGAIQGALIQDGGIHGGYARLLRIDVASGRVRSFAYPLERIGGSDKAPRYAGISDIVAVNDHVLLVDERGGGGLGTGHPARVKRIYRVDLGDARPVDGLHGAPALAARAVHKELFADLVTLLGRHGVSAGRVPEKYEGLSFGPDVVLHGRHLHTLWVSTDNDFRPRVRASDGTEVDNPDRFLVLGFTDADLPGWQRRQLQCRPDR